MAKIPTSTSRPSREDRLLRFLSSLPIFSGLPAEALNELATQAERVALPGGSMLFEQGDPSEAIYLLHWGRLAAWRQDADGRSRRLGQIGPGECVGETGLILEQARTASVFALRDSELLGWSKARFEHLTTQHPGAMLRLSREALQRYARTVNRPSQASCFAVLPGSPGVDPFTFAEELADALAYLGEIRLMLPEEGRACSAGGFSRLEQEVGGLIYVGDADPLWRERSVRQCDAVLMLVDASDDPADALPAPESTSEHTPLHLVLRQNGEPAPGHARRWFKAFPTVTMHHHVRHAHDLRRVARLIGGRATGLVLSGGGARGFAHIGVLRALREANISVDYVAGCSAGAVVGAGLAAGWDDAHLVDAMRAAFVDDNPLSDLTLPLVAMHSGRKVSQVLRKIYGERDIEDLPLPFFCVSSDLSEGALHIHERGALWLALRASSAMPGIVPPVFHQRRVLVDGGVIDNLPVEEMSHRLSGTIIGVDVGGNYRIDTELEESALPSWWRQLFWQWRDKRYPSIARILWRAGMVNSAATAARRRQQCNLLLRPDLTEIDLLGWRQFDRAIELGYLDTVHQLEKNRRALNDAAST